MNHDAHFMTTEFRLTFTKSISINVGLL